MARKKLVASFFTLKQEYQVLQSADVKKAAEGCRFEIEILDADSNGVLQVQQLFRFIHAPAEERPFALVVQTQVPDGLARVARNAAGAGVGWVFLNRVVPYLEALRGEHANLALSSVTTDHAEIGRIQAQQYRALLPHGGRVLYLQGPPSSQAAQERLAAAQEGVRGTGVELKVVPAEWTESSAEAAVKAWLRLKTSELFAPDLVGSQNDAMALGAQKALRAHRPEWAQVPYTGCDGLADGGQRLVAIGQLSATIVVPSCGGPAVDLLDHVYEEGTPAPRSVVVPPRSFPPIEALARVFLPQTQGARTSS
jgi:ABC-type sugar transport system substrate-binding protein